MKVFDLQLIESEYLSNFYNEVQIVRANRINLRINQNRIASMCGVSLRTIQNFESYNAVNDFLLFKYKRALEFINSKNQSKIKIKII